MDQSEFIYSLTARISLLESQLREAAQSLGNTQQTLAVCQDEFFKKLNTKERQIQDKELQYKFYISDNENKLRTLDQQHEALIKAKDKRIREIELQLEFIEKNKDMKIREQDTSIKNKENKIYELGRELENTIKSKDKKINELEVQLEITKREYTKLKDIFEEQERRRKLSKVIPVIYDDESYQYDCVINHLNVLGKSNYITFKIMRSKEISNTKLVLYFINLSTPRLEENYNNEKFDKIARDLGPTQLEKVVIRYGTNSSAFPDFFQSEEVKYQLIYNGKDLLDCRANVLNIEKLSNQIIKLQD